LEKIETEDGKEAHQILIIKLKCIPKKFFFYSACFRVISKNSFRWLKHKSSVSHPPLQSILAVAMICPPSATPTNLLSPTYPSKEF
jgi:hypothetical protein